MYKRILVAVDGSDTSELAIRAAIGLARASGGRIRLVHVVDEGVWFTADDPHGGSPAGLYEALRNWGDELLRKGLETVRAAGVESDTMLVDQPGRRLGESVANAAKLWNADLLVVGTHGRKGFDRLVMGSGAEQMIRLAPVPVLVIRASQPSSKEKP